MELPEGKAAELRFRIYQILLANTAAHRTRWVNINIPPTRIESGSDSETKSNPHDRQSPQRSFSWSVSIPGILPECFFFFFSSQPAIHSQHRNHLHGNWHNLIPLKTTAGLLLSWWGINTKGRTEALMCEQTQTLTAHFMHKRLNKTVRVLRHFPLVFRLVMRWQICSLQGGFGSHLLGGLRAPRLYPLRLSPGTALPPLWPLPAKTPPPPSHPVISSHGKGQCIVLPGR